MIDPKKPAQGLNTMVENQEITMVCIANISPRERRKRLASGVIIFVISLAVLTVLVAAGVDRLWRLPLLLLFWGAAVGFFQWLDKT